MASAFSGIVDRSHAQSTALVSYRKLWDRCFMQFTGSRFPLVPTGVIASIYSGISDTNTAVDGCMQLLDLARLGSDGMLVSNTQISRDILFTFQNFHQNWFPTHDFQAEILTKSNHTEIQKLVMEQDAPAGFITKALFQDLSYDFVVSHHRNLAMIRNIRSETGVASRNSHGFELHRQVSDGELIGIQDIDSTRNVERYNDSFVVRNSSSNSDLISEAFFNRMLTNDAANNQGSGILGSSSFVLLNWYLGERLFPGTVLNPDRIDDGMILSRRLPKAVFESLLCKDLPNLRPSDVATRIQSSCGPGQTPDNSDCSNLRNHTNSLCVQCHASIDQMSAVYNGFALLDENNSMDNNRAMAVGPARSARSMPSWSRPFLPDRDTNFYKRIPRGKLVYRTANGGLVETSIDSIADLGQKIAQQEDFYSCAASRYFYFLTGIQVDLNDPGISSGTLSSVDVMYRNKVIGWGRRFQNHKSLNQLIEDIISDRLYQQVQMR